MMEKNIFLAGEAEEKEKKDALKKEKQEEIMSDINKGREEAVKDTRKNLSVEE